MITGFVGSSYSPEFNQAAVDLNLGLVKASKIEQLFDMLLVNRIDVLLSTERMANQLLLDDKYAGKISRAHHAYYGKGLHIGFSKKSKAKFLIPESNEIIQKMIADGSLQAIVDKY